MQSTSAVIDAGESAEILTSQIATETFGNILSGGLPSLYRSAYRLLRNSADAEDAVQDALLAAYTHLDQFRGHSKMSTWLGVIVHNSARMQLRKRLRHIHVPLDETNGDVEEQSMADRLADCRPSPEDEYRNNELSMRLAHFQTQLTPTLNKTFQLRDVDGLSVREAARILGVPTGTVKAQSARARKKINRLMRKAIRAKARKAASSGMRQTLARV